VDILSETLQAHLHDSASVVGELRIIKDILDQISRRDSSSPEEVSDCTRACELAASIVSDMAVTSLRTNFQMKSLLVSLEELVKPPGVR
jgi:hypothetical protein